MSKAYPMRRCAATRREAPQGALLRFVAGPNNAPFLDVAHKLPGRGVNLTPSKQAYQKAIKDKVFGRELQTNQPAPAWEDITAALEKDALNRLGLAKKSGQAHPGWEGIKAAKHLCGILLATDAGKDIQEKTSLLTARYSLLILLSKEELAHAMGLPNVAAVGISAPHTWQALQKLAEARKEEQI